MNLPERAREIALKVFEAQAKATLCMANPIEAIEQALLTLAHEVREETIRKCDAIALKQPCYHNLGACGPMISEEILKLLSTKAGEGK